MSAKGSNLALNAGFSLANEIRVCIKASDLGYLLLVLEFLGQIVSLKAKCQSWSLLLETLLEISLVPYKPHFPKFPLLRFICLVFSKIMSCLVVIPKTSKVWLLLSLASWLNLLEKERRGG